MLVYISKFESFNSTDGVQIINKEDINSIKEENFIMGIFIPFDENCSYDKLLYTYDFELFINNVKNDEWISLEKKELDNSEVIV